jgi:hypothetical protein
MIEKFKVARSDAYFDRFCRDSRISYRVKGNLVKYFFDMSFRLVCIKIQPNGEN